MCFYWLNNKNLSTHVLFPRLYNKSLINQIDDLTTPEIFVRNIIVNIFFYIIRCLIQFLYLLYIPKTHAHSKNGSIHCLFIFWEYKIKIYDFLLLIQDKETKRKRNETKKKKIRKIYRNFYCTMLETSIYMLVVWAMLFFSDVAESLKIWWIDKILSRIRFFFRRWNSYRHFRSE